MTKPITQFFIALCMFALLTTNSAIAEASPDTELQIFKAQTEAKIDAVKESQQKDLEFHKQLVTSQNERIEQINHQVDWLGNLIALGSLIITLLLVVIGYFAYGKAESVAKKVAADDANSTSKAEVKRWFDENLAGVNQEIADLKIKLQKTTQEVGEHADMAHQNIEESNEKVRTHAIQIIAANPLSADSKSTLTEKEKQTLEQASTSLKAKPEEQYTFDDWNTRAFSAVAENNFALAAEYWKSAAAATDATDEQVAQALYNQGVALGQQNKFDEAITCYQKLVQRFGSSSLPLLQVQVAQALTNQGSMLHLQDKFAEAIECCQQVVYRYSNSPLPALQDEVARALASNGFVQFIRAKRAWNQEAERAKLLSESLILFERANEKLQTNNLKANVLGMMAHVLWLLGRVAEVETPLRKALTIGSEQTFNDEISDTKISPVPADAEFAQLVTRLWSEINPQQVSPTPKP
jgi:tetratricopeptide (TPR) repeat protein